MKLLCLFQLALLASGISALVFERFGDTTGVDIFDDVPGDNPVQTCSTPEPKSDILHIERVDVSPNPPQAGQPLDIIGRGTLSEDLPNGTYVEVEVKYGVIRILRQTIDFCEQSGKIGLQCPIEKGLMDLKRTIDLPKEIPPGKYRVHARLMKPDEPEPRQITCLNAEVVFPRRF